MNSRVSERREAELWHRLRATEVCGSLRIAGDWATRQRCAGGTTPSGTAKSPPARKITRFARALRADQTAVAAALREPWPNGEAKGQINRLETPKRQMYGRVLIDILKGRLVVAS